MTGAKVSIFACGMMTSVGFTAPATCAAIRARITNFQETRFAVSGGDWVLGSEVPLEPPLRGIPKLAKLVIGPISECLESHESLSSTSIPLLLCISEKTRPGRLAGLEEQLFSQIVELTGRPYHNDSRIIAQGVVGVATALRYSTELIESGRQEFVLIAGVDSYLVSQTINHFDHRDRLLTPANSNGFIPGEAGAAILVGSPNALSSRRIDCLGMGFGDEVASIESDLPLRGDGLRTAIQIALNEAGKNIGEIDYRIADLTGEQYGFKEADLAMSRIHRDRHKFQEIWHPADCIGNVGSALLPCALGLALTAAHKEYAEGKIVLIHGGIDSGRRAAIVLSEGEPLHG